MSVQVGDAAPAFELSNQDREDGQPRALKGRKSLIVFIPFPFTGICEGELCMIRDNLADLGDMDANVVCHHGSRRAHHQGWAEANHFGFSVLSDYWPHGETAKAYGAFNDKVGAANRYTFVLDEEDHPRHHPTESLGIGREFDEYTKALEAI